ncbi:hypothetical protein JL720_15693 [Aureococcus anophagefferens]|nr:hypothetical protein JL720_15693 [Aureococcus anophagefferens]
MLSPSFRCRFGDDAADGYVRGEGVGAAAPLSRSTDNIAPRSLHFCRPNAHVPWDALRVRVLQLPDAFSGDAAATVGVSPFGFGGALGHVAVGRTGLEALEKTAAPRRRAHAPRGAARSARSGRGPTARPRPWTRATTMRTKRSRPPPRPAAGRRARRRARAAFTGQGAAYAGMGRALYGADAAFAAAFDAALDAVGRHGGDVASLRGAVVSAADDATRRRRSPRSSASSTPSRGVSSRGSAARRPTPSSATRSARSRPFASRASSRSTAARLVVGSGAAMGALAPGVGAMAAVRAGVDRVREVLGDDAPVACDNSPLGCSRRGGRRRRRRRAPRRRRRRVDAPARGHGLPQRLRGALPRRGPRAAGDAAAAAAVYSTLTGARLADAPTADYWVDQARRPVAFAAALRRLDADAADTVVVEVGPAAHLAPHVAALGASAVATLGGARDAGGEPRAVLKALGGLYALGADLAVSGDQRPAPADGLRGPALLVRGDAGPGGAAPPAVTSSDDDDEENARGPVPASYDDRGRPRTPFPGDARGAARRPRGAAVAGAAALRRGDGAAGPRRRRGRVRRAARSGLLRSARRGRARGGADGAAGRRGHGGRALSRVAAEVLAERRDDDVRDDGGAVLARRVVRVDDGDHDEPSAVACARLVRRRRRHLRRHGRRGARARGAFRARRGARRAAEPERRRAVRRRALREALLAAAEEKRATVDVVALDVCDGGGGARRASPRAPGLVHGAGVVDDGALRSRTRDTLRRALDPSSAGRCASRPPSTPRDAQGCPPLALEVYLSSITALLGNAGQSDYGAASAALDALAASRRRKHARRAAVSVHSCCWASCPATPASATRRAASRSARSSGLERLVRFAFVAADAFSPRGAGARLGRRRRRPGRTLAFSAEAAAAGCLYVFLWALGCHAAAVLCKWLVGHQRPGVFPTWTSSAGYRAALLANAHAASRPDLWGAALAILPDGCVAAYLRALGADVGRDVTFSGTEPLGTFGGFDLLTIRDGAVFEVGAGCAPFSFRTPTRVALGHVHVGRHARLGCCADAKAGAHVGDGAVVCAGAGLDGPLPRAPTRRRAASSGRGPARRSRRAPATRRSACPRPRRDGGEAARGRGDLLLDRAARVPRCSGRASSRPQYRRWSAAVPPGGEAAADLRARLPRRSRQAVSGPAVGAVAVARVMRCLLLGDVRSQLRRTVPLTPSFVARHAVVDAWGRASDAAAALVKYSGAMNAVWRALGLRVGARGAILSELLGNHALLELVDVGDFSYLAARVAVFAAADARGVAHLYGVAVGEGCFVGPLSVLMPGAALEDGAATGSCAVVGPGRARARPRRFRATDGAASSRGSRGRCSWARRATTASPTRSGAAPRGLGRDARRRPPARLPGPRFLFEAQRAYLRALGATVGDNVRIFPEPEVVQALPEADVVSYGAGALFSAHAYGHDFSNMHLKFRDTSVGEHCEALDAWQAQVLPGTHLPRGTRLKTLGRAIVFPGIVAEPDGDWAGNPVQRV